MKGKFMKYINNENGIALVTSLMFTVLALVISMSLLYMVIIGTKSTGALKRYRTAIDATYGGVDVITKEVIFKAFDFQNYSSGSNPFKTHLTNELGSLANKSISECFRIRLTQPKKNWGICSNITSTAPDISFQLNATSGSPYRVYTNIVDTSEWKITSFSGTGVSLTTTFAGNSGDGSSEGTGLSKGGAGYGTSPTKIPHYPYIYKIEVQGERQRSVGEDPNSPHERGNVSVLYAY